MSNTYQYGPDNQDKQGGSGQSQGQGQQNYNYQYKYSYGSGSGRGATPSGGYKPPKRADDWGEWIGIGLLLFILPFNICKIIGVIWLIRKLVAMANSGQGDRYRREARNAANRVKSSAERVFHQADESTKEGARDFSRQAGPYAQSAPKNAGASAAQSKQAAQPKAEPWEGKAQPDAWNVRDSRENKRKKAKKEGGGTGFIIGGGILAGIFGLGTLACMTPVFLGEFEFPLLIPIIACLMFMGGGIGMLASGIGKNQRSERYLNYLAYIGANREVALAPMAASFGVPVSKLCKDLRRMLSKGILPTGYLDLAEGKLFLTEMGYHAPEAKREAPPVQEETPQEAAAREDDILREIRQVNDDIPDAVMTAKIDRIEEITGKILRYQKEHPNKEGQLRTFLNYYLPTTLKILRAYAQLDAQGIEGENISAAKERIEGMMDQVVSGFEKQLDKLFQDDAMDITSDVEVLENMLKKDGLSDEGGITMTL